MDHAIEQLLSDVGRNDIADTHTHIMVREVVHTLFFMLGGLNCRCQDPLPREFVANLRERIPCDGATNAS